MDFNSVVVPLVAQRNESDDRLNIGSGFLVRINSQIYLVTVAHLCDYALAPRMDWSLWPEEIFLVDKIFGKDGNLVPLATFSLFFEGYLGKRVPRFKYVVREDIPASIADIILLPLQTDDLVVEMYDVFDLPLRKGVHEPGAEVTQLGRRSEFPALSVSQHVSSYKAGPLRFMEPVTQQGDSGGPVVSSTGLLLGMNVGSHKDMPAAAMLMSPEAIEAVATAVRGVAKEWPQFEAETPAPL